MSTPSNADILKELKNIQTTLITYGTDISELKAWRIGVEAAKVAIEEYKHDHPNRSNNTVTSGSLALNKELMEAVKLLLKVIGVLAAAFIALKLL